MVVDESPSPAVRRRDCDIDILDPLDFKKLSVASQDDTCSPSPSTAEDSSMTSDSMRDTTVVPSSTAVGSRLRRLREVDRQRGSLNDSSHHSTLTYGSNHEGYSGYATKPTEFVSPHSLANRRSWRPKDTSSSLASPKRGNSCPVSGPYLTKNTTAQAHEAVAMEEITQNPSHLPPLSRRSTHGKLSQSSAVSEFNQTSHSTSGDQTDMGSSSGIPRKVRSWRPKTPSMPSSPEDQMKTSKAQIPLSYLPTIPLDSVDNYSSSSPVSTEKPLGSLPSPKMWTRHESDTSLLPPAFQASLASPRRTPIGGYQRRTLDITRIECVSPMAKEKPKVGKLIYQWPPTQDHPGNSNRAQFLRTLGALSIKELSAAFEKQTERSSMLESSTMTAIDVVMRMVQDSAHHIMTDKDNRAPTAPPNDEEHARIIEAVDRVLQDENLLSAVWAASADIDEYDEDWTCTGLPANLSEQERREVISNVVKVMKDKTVLAGVWARSSQPGASATDTQASIGDFRWQTSVKIHWSGHVHRDDEGVPLCFRGSYEDATGDKLPLAPLLRDRFGDRGLDLPLSTVKRSPSFTLEPLLLEDRFGKVPTDVPPAGIKRSRSSLNEAHSGSPVVWVARWCISDDPSEDETWMVTRVWNDAIIDEKETRHQVSRGELVKKVKELLGIPMDDTTPASIDDVLYDAKVEDWCIQKVYDLNGKIQASSKTMKVDEHGMIRCFDEVDQAATISSRVLKSMTTEDSKVMAVSIQKSRPVVSASPVAEEIDRESMTEPTYILEDKLAFMTNNEQSDRRVSKRSARKEKKETKKEKKQANGPSSIWDLLSPPPVFLLVDPPPES